MNEFRIKNGWYIDGQQPITSTTNDVINLNDVNSGQYDLTTTNGIRKTLNDNYFTSAQTIDLLLVSNKTCYVSDSHGDDATAMKGNIHKSFKTIEAAVSAATSGDLVYVFKDDYILTTTSANGIAKDGVDYFFESDAHIIKNTNNPIFATDNTFTVGCNIYGSGNFTRSGGTGNMFTIQNNLVSYTTVLNFNRIISLNNNICISVVGCNLNIIGNYINTYDSRAISISATYVSINVKEIYNESATNYTINDSSSILVLKTDSIRNFNGNTLCYYGQTGYKNFDITYGLGIFYFLQVQNCLMNFSYIYNVNINGTGLFTLNGNMDTLTDNGGTDTFINFTGNIYTLSKTGNSKLMTFFNLGDAGTRNINISNGETSINGNMVSSANLKFNITGGNTIINSKINASNLNNLFDINSATANVTINSDISSNGDLIYLKNGKLFLNNSRIISSDGNVLLYESGTTYCNGCSLITDNIEKYPITNFNQDKNIKVLSGGLNVNKETFESRKQKINVVISGTTLDTEDYTITLNSSAFTSSTGHTTYESVVIALTNSILTNSNYTVVNNGNNLDIEYITAANNFTYSTSKTAGTGTISNSLIRYATFPLTNITGGIVIESDEI